MQPRSQSESSVASDMKVKQLEVVLGKPKSRSLMMDCLPVLALAMDGFELEIFNDCLGSNNRL